MEIALGNGSVEVNTLSRDGRIGLLLRPQNDHHEIGEFTKTGGEEYYPEQHSDHVVVWLDRLESARILQDTINEAVLKMQGIPQGCVNVIETEQITEPTREVFEPCVLGDHSDCVALVDSAIEGVWAECSCSCHAAR